MAVLDLRCCAGFSVASASVGYSLVAACRLLIAVASLVAVQTSVGYLFTYGYASCHVALFTHLTLSPLPMSISLFTMSVSPSLPCN